MYGVVADHHRQGLGIVEQLTPLVDGLHTHLVSMDKVSGAVIVSTCNRVEIYIESDSDSGFESASHLLSGRFGSIWPKLDIVRDDDVVKRLFRLACGLESQVVGEREITGQMRRALGRARQLGTASFVLAQTFEAAIRASKRVEHETGLAGRGRSIVAVGLNLISSTMPLAGKTAIIVGTGNYAGAVAARLKENGLGLIQVYSESGRAARFARMHRLVPVPDEGLIEAMTVADLVITCRGYGRPVIPVAKVEQALRNRPPGKLLAMLDLAVTHDIEAQVCELDDT